MVLKLNRVHDGGSHITLRLFVGEDADHLAKAGEIVVRRGEYETLRQSLGGNSDLSVIFDD